MNFRDTWATTENGQRFVFTVEMQRRLSEAGLPVEPESLADLNEGPPVRQKVAPTPQKSTHQATPPPDNDAFAVEIDPVTGKYIGKLKWYNSTRGYGFIARGGDEDIFFHKSDVLVDADSLQEGEWILYDVEDTDKGLEASEIEPFQHPAKS